MGGYVGEHMGERICVEKFRFSVPDRLSVPDTLFKNIFLSKFLSIVLRESGTSEVQGLVRVLSLKLVSHESWAKHQDSKMKD